MEHVAAGLLKSGKTVAITTTTKIFVREPYVLLEDGLDKRSVGPFVRVGTHLEEGKLTAVGFDDIQELGRRFDTVLIEADGAKGMPLKFPADHEPVIPPFSEKIFVVSGLDSLFGRVDEKVFRWELFRGVTGIQGDARITPEVFLRLFDDDALLKGVDRERSAVVLNKYDALEARGEAASLAKQIITATDVNGVIISSTLLGVFYEITKRG